MCDTPAPMHELKSHFTQGDCKNGSFVKEAMYMEKGFLNQSQQIQNCNVVPLVYPLQFLNVSVHIGTYDQILTVRILL